MAPSPAVWNDVALLLANHKVALDRAQQYATSRQSLPPILSFATPISRIRPAII